MTCGDVVRLVRFHALIGPLQSRLGVHSTGSDRVGRHGGPGGGVQGRSATDCEACRVGAHRRRARVAAGASPRTPRGSGPGRVRPGDRAEASEGASGGPVGGTWSAGPARGRGGTAVHGSSILDTGRVLTDLGRRPASEKTLRPTPGVRQPAVIGALSPGSPTREAARSRPHRESPGPARGPSPPSSPRPGPRPQSRCSSTRSRRPCHRGRGSLPSPRPA